MGGRHQSGADWLLALALLSITGATAASLGLCRRLRLLLARRQALLTAALASRLEASTDAHGRYLRPAGYHCTCRSPPPTQCQVCQALFLVYYHAQLTHNYITSYATVSI